MARTLTDQTARERRGPSPATPCLVRLLDYEHPHVAGSRHELAEIGEVALGRGDAFAAERDAERLALAIPDPRMSERHARLARTSRGWEIEDLGSRNGTFVEGERVERAAIADGAVIELGRTALLFRIGERADAADIAATDLEAALPGIATFSVPFERQLGNVGRLARAPHHLVLHGETGTGKEVVARAIHVASGRPGGFVAVNCGALPPTLIESELFGYKKGAFSGALEDRAGLVRTADTGTLFLDEIADLAGPTQAALLRVLQEREVLPLGASRPVPVDIRVIAASHRDLEHEVAAGRFREDLLARLAGYVVTLPPLRERREDLGLLVAALLARALPDGRAIRLAPEAGCAIARYRWPRNIRELEQALATAATLADGGTIELEHLPPALAAEAPAAGGDADLAPSELRRRDELIAKLAHHDGNVAAVARAMGVARMQVHRWLERYAIDVDAYRK